jgi:hypothetical protein
MAGYLLTALTPDGSSSKNGRIPCSDSRRRQTMDDRALAATTLLSEAKSAIQAEKHNEAAAKLSQAGFPRMNVLGPGEEMVPVSSARKER